MEALFRIEFITEDDVAAVAAIAGPPQPFEQRLRDEMVRPWSRTWVARDSDARVVGFLIAWHVADELHVLDLATRADRRRRGVGTALMRHALGYAQTHGVLRLLLEVRRSNAGAIALYRAVGFFVTGVRARYYPDDEDALEMALQIDPQTGEVVCRPDDVDAGEPTRRW